MFRSMRIAAFVGLFGLSVVVAAQQTGDSKKPAPSSSVSNTVEASWTGGAGVPSRRVQTRTESNGREVVTETTETPGPDGKFRMSRETKTETARTGDSTQTKQDVYADDGQGRRRLVETTQTDVTTSRDGSSRSVANTMVPDLNGRLALSSQEVRDTKSSSPSVRQTDTSVFRPGVNGPLVETERLQETERKVSSGVTQSESTRFLPDGNGRWKPTEKWNQEVRTSGGEIVAEETVQRVNDNGSLALSEKRVTKQSKTRGQEQTVIESYSEGVQGTVRISNGLQLTDRVRVTSSTAADGTQQTIREVESRNPVAPNEPLRVIERTVETVRKVGPDRWEMQRQVFALDGNGRLTPVLTEKGESAGK